MRAAATAFFLLLLTFTASALQGDLSAAKQAERQGRTDEAIRLYREYLQSHPDDYTGQYSLGALLLRKGEYEEAVLHLERAHRLQPDRAEPNLALASAYLSLQQPADALAALKRAEKVAGSAAEYWSMRAGIEAILGDSAAASSALRAHSLAPARLDIALQAASILSMFGKHREAAELYQKAFDLSPSSWEIRVSRGQELLAAGEAEAALQEADEILAAQPTQPAAAVLKAKALLALQRPEEALNFLSAALEGGIEAPRLAPVRAECLVQLKRDAEAARVLDEAAQTAPADPEVQAARARLYLKLGNFAEAERSADQLLRVAPKWDESYLVALEVARSQKKQTAEEIILRNWIAFLPNDPRPYKPLAERLLARDSWAEAGVVLDAYLRIRPTDADAYALMAQAFLGAGDASTPIARLKTALSQGVESEAMYLYLALAYRKQQENGEAIRTLETLVQKYPKSERGWSLLATIQEPTRPEGALQVYTRMLEALPGNLEAIKGRARMLGRLGRHEQAAEEWIRLAKEQKSPGPYYFAAMEYREAKKPEKADAMWAELEQAKPEDVELLSVHAQYLADVERVDEAYDVLKRMARIAPENPDVYLTGARILVDRNRPKEAIEFLKPGSGVLYKNFQFFQLLAKASAAAKDAESAIAITEDLFRRELYSVPMMVAFVDGQARKRKLPDAIRAITEATQKHPEEMSLFVGLARAKALTGDGRGALEALDRAVELAPSDVETLQVYAQAAEAEGDATRAARAFELLSKALPNEPNYVLKHAGYLRDLGKKAQAISVLRGALERFPGNAEILKMLQDLGG